MKTTKIIKTNISADIGCELISQLKKMNGAIDYSGDCSYQVVFLLKNGETLRFGVTDDDVAEHPGFLSLWEQKTHLLPAGGMNATQTKYLTFHQSVL